MNTVSAPVVSAPVVSSDVTLVPGQEVKVSIPVINLERLTTDARVIDLATVTTRQLITDCRLATSHDTNIPDYLIGIAASAGQWLAARRGKSEEKIRLFGVVCSGDLKPRGLSNSLRDLVALSSDPALSPETRAKYADMLLIARLVNSVAKMVSDDKNQAFKSQQEIIDHEASKASKAKEDREQEKASASASALVIAEQEEKLKKLSAFLVFSAEVINKPDSMTKSQIIARLAELSK